MEDKPRSGQPKKFEDKELEALLEEDQNQTQEEFAESLGITQQAVSVRLRAMGMIQKQGNWMPYWTLLLLITGCSKDESFFRDGIRKLPEK